LKFHVTHFLVFKFLKKMSARQKTKRKTVSKTYKTSISASISRQQRLFASIPSQSVSLKHRLAEALDENSPPVPFINCQCPYCSCELTSDEVEDGFLDQVDDYTTQCPSCKKRFETSGTIYLSGKIERFVWLCFKQTQNELTVWAKNHDLFISRLVDELLDERPELAWNAYRHCYNDRKTCKECNQYVLPTIVGAVHTILNKKIKK